MLAVEPGKALLGPTCKLPVTSLRRRYFRGCLYFIPKTNFLGIYTRELTHRARRVEKYFHSPAPLTSL